jgi:aspartate carbamoyltransferase catalytic subunit
MRKMLEAELSLQTMELRQMGADVSVVNSKMCYVKFVVNEVEVEYVYNINKKGNYFLERIKPYPLPIKEFQDESDVISIIKIDLEQFENASLSSNINTFININRKLHRTIKKFEDLFLYYNIPENHVMEIMSKLIEIDGHIDEIKVKSDLVYKKKQPDNL